VANPFHRLPTHPLFHFLLFLLTLATTTFFGGFGLFSDRPIVGAASDPAVWRAGLAFSIPLLLILGIHELGHTIACRHYGLPATLPYFIPAPVGIGTFGAVISIRAAITSKKTLLDVGAAGPLAGFLAALPVLWWGVSTSHPTTVRPQGEFFEFGEPLLFRWAEHALVPATRHGADLALSPPGFAAWFGLLVTALNLLPLAQLDGGHILYAAIGKLQRPVGFVLFAALLALSVLWPGWLVWAVIVLVMGIAHPPTEDPSEKLDPKRKFLALVCLAVFLICFTPVPIRTVRSSPPAKTPQTYRL
jgi:membrane-associated protease RseP (regulator of RpoE activity)